MRKQAIIVSIAAVVGLTGLAFSLGSSSAPVAATPTTSTTVASESTVWGTLPSDTTTTSTAPTKALSKGAAAPSSPQSTTSTSEKPAPLTAAQEATIQAGLDASDAAQEDAREHMPHGEDYELPYDTTTTVEFVETSE